ncbi:hypothetical protein WKG86_00705 [Pantoea agglomerans]|uniref:hypothetical protein n=1 Tax=Enterobacter agglomerans TaxID=549 RepID=UPI003C7C01A6
MNELNKSKKIVYLAEDIVIFDENMINEYEKTGAVMKGIILSLAMASLIAAIVVGVGIEATAIVLVQVIHHKQRHPESRRDIPAPSERPDMLQRAQQVTAHTRPITTPHPTCVRRAVRPQENPQRTTMTTSIKISPSLSRLARIWRRHVHPYLWQASRAIQTCLYAWAVLIDFQAL